MEEARVNIDPFRHIDELVKDTVKALRPILPIRFEEVKIAVKIPPTMQHGRSGRSRLLPRSSGRSGKKTGPGSAWSEFLPVCRTSSTTSSTRYQRVKGRHGSSINYIIPGIILKGTSREDHNECQDYTGKREGYSKRRTFRTTLWQVRPQTRHRDRESLPCGPPLPAV